MALQFEDDLQTTFAEWPMACIGLGQTNVPTGGKTAPIPGAIEILPTPTGDGPGYCSTVKPGDPITYGAIRAYIAYGREPAHNNGNAAERWYRWDWYFPPDWTSPDLMSVMQFHDTPDDPELPVVFPNFELMTQGDDLWCWVPLTCTVRQSYAVCPPGYGSLKVSSLKGRWLKCAIHCNWSNANDGYLEVWIDGKLFVRDWFKPNSYADLVGPYWDLGFYDWTHGGLSREYKLWHRNVKIYNTGHTAQEVLGAEPKLPPAPVLPVVLKRPDVVYQPPFVIDDALITSRGSNVFTGNWESSSFSENGGRVIHVNTTQPVIIENSRFRSRSQHACIHSITAGTQITVRNCIAESLNPNTANQAAGYFLKLGQPGSVVCENNTIIGGGGILLAGSPSPATSLVRIRYNRMNNVNGLLSDGAGGYVFEAANTVNVYFQARQFLQINQVRGILDADIRWNEVVNEPFVSRPEDNINIYGATGVSGSPIKIRDNFIFGGWCSRPLDLASYSGGGILCDRGSASGDWTDEATIATKWIDIDDNQVVGLVQHGISAPYGNNLNARRNRIICPNKLNGQTILAANVGATVGGSLRSVVNGFTFNVLWDDNVIGCVNAAGSQNNSWIPSVTATGVASASGGTKTRLTITHGLQAADNGNLVPVWSGTNWTPGNYAFTYVDATHIDLDVAWNPAFGNPTLRSLTVKITNTTNFPFPTEADAAAEWTIWNAKKTAAGVVVGSNLVL